MSIRKYPIDEDYFEKIDTEEKAYILGFLYADGCNHINDRGSYVELTLAKQDEEILIKISKLILFGNVHLSEYERDETRQNRVRFLLNNKKISDDLVKWGVVPRKTFVLKFPELLDNNLHNHFIRGYFDGDGSLTFYGKGKIPTANFSILSTMEMLKSFGEKCKELNINYGLTKRHKDRDNNNYTLKVSGNLQIKKICDYLYKDATIFLKRKYDNYIKLQNLPLHHPITDEQIILAFKANSKMSLEKLSKIIKMDRHVLSRRLKELKLK